MSSSDPNTSGILPLLERVAAAFADWFWSNVVIGTFGLWMVGQVFRDGSRLTALCLFVPTVFYAAVLLVAACLAWLCTCRRIALASLILSLGPAMGVLLVENRWHHPSVTADPARRLRLVHWNVGGASGRTSAVIERLKPHHADVYVLSEVYQRPALDAIAKGLGADYRVCQVRRMGIISRGQAKLVLTKERIKSRGYFIEWASKAGPLMLFVVDLPSHPPYYRGRWLWRVRERVHAICPDLIVGDLNASRRTRALNSLPSGYVHAYAQAGAGWSATWPDSFPLWDLDQCMAGPRIRPLRYHIESTTVSDHRMGVFDFDLAPPAAAPESPHAVPSPTTAASPAPSTAPR